MNIGLFGGTFDPIHHGHLALARAAKERFELGRIYFVPANVPPHKQRRPVTPFFHRYAMVVLATVGEKVFVPSLLEAPGVVTVPGSAGKGKKEVVADANYSVDTVRRLKESLKKIDRVFFLIGMDAFAEIAQWHQAEALFREVEFVVASRPGYSLADVANALPEKIRPPQSVSQPFAKQPAKGRSGAERRHHPLARECASGGLGDGDPGGSGGEEAVAQVCGGGSGGVHEERRTVFLVVGSQLSVAGHWSLAFGRGSLAVFPPRTSATMDLAND